MAKLVWSELTRDEIARARDAGAVVVMAVGAIEQHGSHMPVGTDALLSTAVAERAAERAQGPVLVAPPLPYGFSPHHLSQPGTVSLRLSTWLSVIGDMARSFADTGFRRIVFVNGHGGNAAPLRSCIAELVTDGIAATGVDYWGPDAQTWIAQLNGSVRRFGHACEFETSLMMALLAERPELQRALVARAAGLPPRAVQPWMPPGVASDPITDASAAWPPVFQQDDAGYFGDPAAATPENGARILAGLAERLAAFLDAFAQATLRVGRGQDGPRYSLPVRPAAQG